MNPSVAAPTSPSHACGVGPSLSPLKGREGLWSWVSPDELFRRNRLHADEGAAAG
jgi:hypothetical protein